MFKSGFSLVELLTVVAVIGILAAIGTLGYQNFIDGTRDQATDVNRTSAGDKIITDNMAQQISENVLATADVDDDGIVTCREYIDLLIEEHSGSNAYEARMLPQHSSMHMLADPPDTPGRKVNSMSTVLKIRTNRLT